MGSDRPRITVETIRCSFCETLRDQVGWMVAGRGAYICDECADLVNEIMEDELPTWPWQRTRPEIVPRVRSAPSVSVTTGPSTEVTIPPGIEDDLARLWNDAKNWKTTRDTSALPALLEHYQPLADHYVDGLVIDSEVFAQEARRALVQSILWFDEREGEPFETVALKGIQDAIYAALVVALELPRDLRHDVGEGQDGPS